VSPHWARDETAMEAPDGRAVNDQARLATLVPITHNRIFDVARLPDRSGRSGTCFMRSLPLIQTLSRLLEPEHAQWTAHDVLRLYTMRGHPLTCRPCRDRLTAGATWHRLAQAPLASTHSMRRRSQSGRTGIQTHKALMRPTEQGAPSVARILDRPHVCGLQTFRSLSHVEFDLLPLLQGTEAIGVDRRVVAKNVFAPAVLGNEAEAL
jgi:hypothetical protein